MDCDQVFMVLTRGPFPSGAADDALVQMHLEQCPSCWRFAEALRPASDLFQEAIPPAESRTLPGYWGDCTPPGLLISRIAQSAREESTREESRQAKHSHRQSGRVTPSTKTGQSDLTHRLALATQLRPLPIAPKTSTTPGMVTTADWKDLLLIAGLLVAIASIAFGVYRLFW